MLIFNFGRYPFRKSTLLKIRQFVDEAPEGLFDAVEVLQLDISEDTQSRIVEIQSLTKETAARTVAIEGSLGQVETQNQSISKDVQDILTLQQRTNSKRSSTGFHHPIFSDNTKGPF